MNKLFQSLDKYLLKIVVGFTIAFIALYPKLPSISITHTWVYIRLEDFLITFVVAVWFLQLIRKKVGIPIALGVSIALYWVVGLVSLIFSILFIGPHLLNFFPKIAALQYFRRIEYMILFFVGFSAVKNKRDVLHYVIILFTTITGIVLYGLGQRFYLFLWHLFPKFFEQNPFCFPAFLTGNEEFAKGVPLCLTDASRVASTFGGHYDLAAYLVFVIPIVVSIFIVTKRWYWKVLTALVGLGAIEMLNFTSSRTSFAAYLVGLVSMLIFWKRKKWILPILFVSIFITLWSNNSVLQRFAKTLQPVQVLTINTSSTALPSNLQKIIKKTKDQEENQTPQSPPPGTVTIGTTAIKSTPASSSSTVTTVVTDKELKKLQESDIAISTESGFFIQKAYALDISFTTRFQAEWPRDWAAFLSSPIFGTGYSSLTLASDNDYLRAVGETGITGLLSFLFIFVILGIYMRHTVKSVKDTITHAFLFGLAGGVVGLLINAILIDVFEASKVAESLWLLLGIGAGGAALFYKKPLDYKKELYTFFISKAMIAVYLLVIILLLFLGSIHNFFVGNDFILLHDAASGTSANIKSYFTQSFGFFYRPITRTVMFFLYSFFALLPEGYHLFSLFLHFLVAVAVFFLAQKLLRNKFYSFAAAVIFLVMPSNAGNIFWVSSLSTNLATVGILYTLLAFWNYKISKNIFIYFITIVLTIFSLFASEEALLLPFFVVLLDLFLTSWKVTKKQILIYIPLLLLFMYYLYLHSITGARWSGNLFDLYGYLASCVFAIVIPFVFLQIKEKYYKNKQPLFVYGLSLFFFIILVAKLIMVLQQEYKNWNYAGNITSHTLKFFKLNNETIPSGSTVAFLNVPAYHNNVSIFPVGLGEGLWFIYRDPTVHVIQVGSIDTANAENAAYIFGFDKKNMIYQIK